MSARLKTALRIVTLVLAGASLIAATTGGPGSGDLGTWAGKLLGIHSDSAHSPSVDGHPGT